MKKNRLHKIVSALFVGIIGLSVASFYVPSSAHALEKSNSGANQKESIRSFAVADFSISKETETVLRDILEDYYGDINAERSALKEEMSKANGEYLDTLSEEGKRKVIESLKEREAWLNQTIQDVNMLTEKMVTLNIEDKKFVANAHFKDIKKSIAAEYCIEIDAIADKKQFPAFDDSIIDVTSLILEHFDSNSKLESRKLSESFKSERSQLNKQKKAQMKVYNDRDMPEVAECVEKVLELYIKLVERFYTEIRFAH